MRRLKVSQPAKPKDLVVKTRSLIRLLTVMLALLASWSIQGQGTLTNGLLGFYPFDGNADDMSGNGRHGTIKGAVLASDRFGATNSAFQFGGNPESIEINRIGLNNRSFSLCAWVYRIAPQVPRPAGSTYGFFGQGTPANRRGLHVVFLGTNAPLRFGFYRDDVETAALIADYEEWHHWVMTYQSQNRKQSIYRDGLLVAAGSTSADFKGSGVFRIGNASWGGEVDRSFLGKVDDVRIYDRTLSAAEVEQLYALESQGMPSTPRKRTSPVERSWLAEHGTTVAAAVTASLISGALAGWLFLRRKGTRSQEGLTIRIVETEGEGGAESRTQRTLEIAGVETENPQRTAELIGAIVEARRNLECQPVAALAEAECTAFAPGEETLETMAEVTPIPSGENVLPNPMVIQANMPDYVAENEAFERKRTEDRGKPDVKALEAAAAAWEQQKAVPRYLKTECGVVTFECGHCGRRVEVGERFVGMETCCPNCGGLQIVPSANQL
jgi:predicted RNA-binding Zn-ribbon protein involved in translation (DUF1610 family)